MVGKSAAVPQVEVWVLVPERLDEVPLLGQVEATGQVPNADEFVESCVPTLRGVR